MSNLFPGDCDCRISSLKHPAGLVGEVNPQISANTPDCFAQDWRTCSRAECGPANLSGVKNLNGVVVS